MSRRSCFILFFVAIFLQSGAYGLTFMLPRLFEAFDANEKVVGAMLFLTTISTISTVYFSGHLSDWFGRVRTLAIACLAIAVALATYGQATSVGPLLVAASLLLGFGWGLTFSLAPIVLTRLINPHQRVQFFAILAVAIMAGFGLSPVLASMLESNGFSIGDAFHITAALCAIAALIFFVLIVPVRKNVLHPGPQQRSNLTWRVCLEVSQSRANLPLFMVFLGASVFAGMNNFQTVFAAERGLDYASYFLIYTITVVVFRIVLSQFEGGQRPYVTIAMLQYVMFGSVVLFMFSGGNVTLYWLVAFLFGIGYGVSYPILAAMAANDASEDLLPQTMQLFALTYFLGIFGFPLVAGWLIVELGTKVLLVITAALALVEASLALRRGLTD